MNDLIFDSKYKIKNDVPKHTCSNPTTVYINIYIYRWQKSIQSNSWGHMDPPAYRFKCHNIVFMSVTSELLLAYESYAIIPHL